MEHCLDFTVLHHRSSVTGIESHCYSSGALLWILLLHTAIHLRSSGALLGFHCAPPSKQWNLDRIPLSKHWSTAWISLCSTFEAVGHCLDLTASHCNLASEQCYPGWSHCRSTGALLGSHCAPPPKQWDWDRIPLSKHWSTAWISLCSTSGAVWFGKDSTVEALEPGAAKELLSIEFLPEQCKTPPKERERKEPKERERNS